MREYLPPKSLMSLVVFAIILEGCFHNYYKVTPLATNTPLTEQIQDISKYFIVHQGAKAWHLSNVSLNAEKTEISGRLEVLPEYHQKYLTTKSDGLNRYKPRIEDPTYEVHLYISEYVEGQNMQIMFPLAVIKKIEIYELNKRATNFAKAYSIAGVAYLTLGIVGTIVLATTSCPFVYIRDGSSWHFIGEMYGSAIFSPLERNDFMPLPGFIPVKGIYEVKISNELLERQYTNLAVLMVVEHPKHSTVLMDKNGKTQTILSLQSPSEAISDENLDYRSALLSKDRNAYLFNDGNSTNKDVSSLVLSFKHPSNAKTGKLVLNAKNSEWLDYVYAKLSELYGSDYNKYAEYQKTIPGEKGIQWALNQSIPLSVYVETEAGWEFVDYFNVIGPQASRDLIMAVDISKVKGEEVRIKLECGFMFWEVDYAAMDFSENIPVEVTSLVPESAIDEKGNDVSSLIAAIDTQYYIQPEIGNEAILTYAAPEMKKNNLKSFFLYSRGYYEYIRDFKGEPDWKYLLSFREKGAFTRFARQQYDELFDTTKLIDLLVN